MFFRNGLILALAGWMGVVAPSAWAEEITLEAAIQRTLQRNPGLRAEGFAIDAMQTQARLEGLAPALTVGADLENVGGTGALSGIHSAETTLRLGQVVELGGKRAARQARGQADVARQRNVLQQRQLDLAAETTRRYISVAKGQQELALTRKQLAAVRATEAAIRERVERGVAQEADLALAQIAIVRADLAQEHAQYELASSRFALTALWGESTAIPVDVTGDLLQLPVLPEFDALADRLVQTPEAHAFALDANRLVADRAVATSAARPDLSFGLGVRRLEALNDQALLFSFSMPLGTRQRSSLAVARVDAEQSALEARQAGSSLEARQQLFARFQELRHSRTEFEAITDRMLPAAEKALALTRAGYDDARYSVLQLTQSQAILLQLGQERLAAAARYHQLLADIERSTAFAGDRP